jgi:hypothetical protein
MVFAVNDAHGVTAFADPTLVDASLVPSPIVSGAIAKVGSTHD